MRSGGFDVAVIGAGANGLVAAAVLGRAGLSVVVLERGEAAGGQGRLVEFAEGFRAAPLALDPGWVPPAAARAIGLAGLPTVNAAAPLTVAMEPARFLTLGRDPARAAEAIRVHSAADAEKWPAFTARLRRLAGFLEILYQRPAPDIDARSPREMLALLDLGRRFRGLGREDMIEFLRTLPVSVWELLDDSFECAPLKAAVAAGGIQDLRQGPRSGGTGFVLLHHLVGAAAGSVRGRLPWRDGPDAFTRAAEGAARAAGATIRTGAAVAGILVKDDAVAGVALETGEEIGVSRVLSTADPALTFLRWVDPVWLDPEFMLAVRNVRHRACTAVAMFALEGLPEFAGLSSREAMAGVVTLTSTAQALERAADAAKYGTISDPPHVELTVPTLLWPQLAPEGRHVLVARAQYAPFHLRDGAAWDGERRGALADSVTAAIERAAPGFSSRIQHRVLWAPPDLEERFGLHEGSVTQGELSLDQILFMRPVPGWGHHATPVAGLYWGGVGTHPGPGVLGGAGWLAARRLLEHRSRG